jgi:hypothetical protein
MKSFRERAPRHRDSSVEPLSSLVLYTYFRKMAEDIARKSYYITQEFQKQPPTFIVSASMSLSAFLTQNSRSRTVRACRPGQYNSTTSSWTSTCSDQNGDRRECSSKRGPTIRVSQSSMSSWISYSHSTASSKPTNAYFARIRT